MRDIKTDPQAGDQIEIPIVELGRVLGTETLTVTESWSKEIVFYSSDINPLTAHEQKTCDLSTWIWLANKCIPKPIGD